VEDTASLGVGPITVQDPFRVVSCGSQSVSFAPVVSDNVSVVTKSIPVVSIPSLDHVSILKRVSSNSEISRSNTTFPVEVVSDSSGCSIKVDCKGHKYKKTYNHTDKDGTHTSPSSGNEGVTVNKSVIFRLKKFKDTDKTDDSGESDSESESIGLTTKRQGE